MITIDVRVSRAALEEALRDDARRGLTSTPKELPPKWFYDDEGSRLFDEITRLPEYYLTRREREILVDRAPEIARLTRAETLIELGSGTSDKTRLLLDALRAGGTLGRFVPFDVSEATLRAAAGAIAAAYPGLEVHAVVGDFERQLDAVPPGPSRLIAFLGSTIGNFAPGPRARFFAGLARIARPGDALLVGFDLVKDRARLEAAYDDAAGVTAAFNRNVLRVLDRELDADFDPDAFDHVARFDEEHAWIEMHLRARRAQRVAVRALGLTVDFAAGEAMRTEISAKFRRAGVERELAPAGFAPEAWWTDAAGDFALALARPVRGGQGLPPGAR